MTIKRKRSSSNNFSPVSISSCNNLSTPEAQSPPSLPQLCDTAMDTDGPSQRTTSMWGFSSAHRVKNSGDWGMRTRKRVRDNRPDEHTIHENTLSKLFTAQRKLPHVGPLTSSQSSPNTTTPIFASKPPQKSTLHSFWNLPAPPVQAPTPIMPQHLHQHIGQSQSQLQSTLAHSNTPRCEDCDAVLQEDAEMRMDVDMDYDESVQGRTWGCVECGKCVCGTCAVVGNVRVCLGCATSGGNGRRW